MPYFRNNKHLLFFSCALIAVLALFAQSLIALFTYAFSNDTYSYILLIPLVSAYFFFIERKKIFSAVGYSFIWGSAILLTGLAIFGAGILFGHALSPANRIPLEAVSFVIAGSGLFLLFFGAHAFTRALFPLLVLLFIIPLPPRIEVFVVEMFRFGSAEMVNLYFRIGGVHFIREGSTFQLENISFYVADQCSGIRSGISLLIVSMIAGKLFLRKPWMRGILMLTVVPIGWVKNGMRIATLTLLGCYVNPGFMSGPLHDQGGKPFFLIGLLSLGIDLFILRLVEKNFRKKTLKSERSTSKEL
jgi:exosortase